MTSDSGRGGLVKALALFIGGTLFGAFAVVQVVPQGKASNVVVSSVGGPTNPGAPQAIPTGGATDPLAQTTSGPAAVDTSSKFACAAGRNGGATDVGVTGNKITLATTEVQSGPGKAFLGDVKYAMEAVKNTVNAHGGICGRLLDITYIDDGWAPGLGAQYLENIMHQNVFAIPVAPSSEGLQLVIKNGDIRKKGIPVVGTDGMLIDQYTDPYVWSVAVSTAATARIMVRRAHELGVKDFSIVFDKNYKFGAEAAQAFNNEVKRVTGHPVDGYNANDTCQGHYCGVIAAQSSYSSEIAAFKPGKLVAMFLEPATALTWMATPGAATVAHDGIMLWGAQPLFTRAFATSCQDACDGMWVWTGYKPPIEAYAQDPLVRKFVTDLHQANPDADEFNAFAEGGYVGMLLLVQAMEKVGANLTREGLKRALDSMKFASGLTMQQSLGWVSGDHFAAATSQAFEIQHKGTFSGWRAKDIVVDPHRTAGTS